MLHLWASWFKQESSPVNPFSSKFLIDERIRDSTVHWWRSPEACLQMLCS